MFDEKWEKRKDRLIKVIEQYRGSVGVTGVPGVGKSTVLKMIPGFTLPERDVELDKDDGTMTVEHQKFLIARCIDELSKKGGIYDRNAIVDGYVFYCLTEEYYMDSAEKLGMTATAKFHADNLRVFKRWFWEYITDYVRYIDFEFNIIFVKSTVSKEELKDRVLGRNRDRDHFDLMDVFIDKFEDFAWRTLIEIRALGVNVNLIEEWL